MRKRLLSLLLSAVMLLGMISVIPMSAEAADDTLAANRICIYSQWDNDVYGYPNGKSSNWFTTSSCGWCTLGHMLQWLGLEKKDTESTTVSPLPLRFYEETGIETNRNLTGAIRYLTGKYSALNWKSNERDLSAILKNGGVALIHKYGHYYLACELSSDGQYVHIVDSCLRVPANNKVPVYRYNTKSGSFERADVSDCSAKPTLRWYCDTGWVMKCSKTENPTYAGGDYWVKYSEVSGKVEHSFYVTCSYCAEHGDHDWATVTIDGKKQCGTCRSCHYKSDWGTPDAADAGTYTVNSNSAYFSSEPYQDASVLSGVKNSEITIVGSIVNCYGNKWYKTSDGYYIYSSYVTKKSTPAASLLAINPAKTSITVTKGSNATFSGTVSSNYNISYLQAKLDGAVVPYANVSGINKTTYTYGSSAISSKLTISSLSVGTHTVTLTAGDSSGKTVSKNVTIVVNAKTVATCEDPKITYSDTDEGKLVTITQNTSGATLCYSTGGSYQRSTSSTTSFRVDADTTVSAYSEKSGMNKSGTVSVTVRVPQLAEPTIGTENTPEGTRITLSSPDQASVYYRTDGEDVLYTGPFTVTENTSISAYAARLGCRRSGEASAYVKVCEPDTPLHVKVQEGSRIAAGKYVTVLWDALPNAAYYTVTVTKDGETLETLDNITESCISYRLADAGMYGFTLTATNAIGTSGVSITPTVEAMDCCTVRFYDVDDFGGLTLLGEQFVDYGDAATAPPDPERKGYTFVKWDTDYSNVTEDLVICPIYRVMVYTVTYKNTNGRTISSENVVYGGMACPPDTDSLTFPSESYQFIGWTVTAADGNSECSLDFVDSNLTAVAAFAWEDQELPVSITSVTATRDDSAESDKNYSVTVTLDNTSAGYTTALLRVNLKTTDENGVTKLVGTESRTVGLRAGSIDNEFTLSLVTKDNCYAKTAEAVVIGFDPETGLTGSTCSAAVTAPVTIISDFIFSDYTAWSENDPTDLIVRSENGKYYTADGFEIEIQSKKQYSYRDKEFTTSQQSNLSGWVNYESALTYTDWVNSGWKTSKPAENATSRITDTRSIVDSAAYTNYTYYHWYGWNSSGTLYMSYGNGVWKNYEEITISSKAPYKATYDGYPAYTYKASGMHGSLWWLKSENYHPAVTHTEWYQQTRSTYTLYYYYRYGAYSDWSDSTVSATDSREVRERTVYRYRIKNIANTADAANFTEDTSGSVYGFDGILPLWDETLDLSGKLATVMVYKGKNTDPNETQLEYVGQTVIGTGNTYSFSFKTREEPSIDTGDFIVSVSLQGGTGLLQLGLIRAPLRQYTVTYYDSYGDNRSVINSVTVSEGENASAPQAPEIDGMRFITWDSTATNVHDNMEITAVYIPVTYAVVFIDWQNGEAFPFAADAGTPLNALAETISEPFCEGHTFLGWDYLPDQTVSGNAVISALYEAETYAVRFFDGGGMQIGETQYVEYGKSAELPEAPEVVGKIFLGWSTDAVWWKVTEDLDVNAIMVYEDTAMEPIFDSSVSDIGEHGEYLLSGEHGEITLTAEDGAAIYYTTDGTVPTTDDFLYTGPIELDETATVLAVTVEPGKNNSTVLEISFEYEESTYAVETDDLVTVGTYNVFAQPLDEIELQLSGAENAGLVGYMFVVECDRNVFYVDYDENGDFDCTAGSDGTLICAPYGETGWQVLWFSTDAAESSGLFTLKLKVSESVEEGVYPIRILYSPMNTVTEDDSAFSTDSLDACLASDGTELIGDVSGDGYITTADVVMIARYLISQISFTADQLRAADTTGNGSVNNADVIRLARYILGMAELWT